MSSLRSAKICGDLGKFGVADSMGVYKGSGTEMGYWWSGLGNKR